MQNNVFDYNVTDFSGNLLECFISHFCDQNILLLRLVAFLQHIYKIVLTFSSKVYQCTLGLTPRKVKTVSVKNRYYCIL